MRNIRIQVAVAVVCCLLGWLAGSMHAQEVKADQVVVEARKVYYNLHEAGFQGLRCDVNVDWDSFVASRKTNEHARETTLSLLRQVPFEVSMGPTGATEVSRHFDGTPPDERTAGSLRQATDAVEQVLTGFFQELSAFLFGPPLPPESENYRIEPDGDRFRVTFGSEAMKVFETLNQDYLIEEMIVVTDKSTTTMRPQFRRGEKGYVPITVDSSVAAAGLDKKEVHIEIAYQNTQGFDLPQTVFVRTRQPAEDFELRFSFANYQITK